MSRVFNETVDLAPILESIGKSVDAITKENRAIIPSVLLNELDGKIKRIVAISNGPTGTFEDLEEASYLVAVGAVLHFALVRAVRQSTNKESVPDTETIH